MKTIETLIQEARTCPHIPADTAEAYSDHLKRMTEAVDSRLMEHPDLDRLIGGNPLRLMRDHHHNHAVFMATVFSFNNMELLCRIVPWMYRTCHNRGFSFDYFPVDVNAWMDVIEEHLEPASAAPILAIYRWMLQHHDDWIVLSRTTNLASVYPGELQEDAQVWVQTLLKGDAQKCLELAAKSGEMPDSVAALYLDALQPAMYQLGKLWEEGSITVAQEHLSTAIVSRIMASLYDRIQWPKSVMGRAVIACTTDEFHEVGARMVADLLEMDGWNVTFLGANTRENELLDRLRADPPDLLGISVSMVFNLKNVRNLITRIRNCPELLKIKILIGGQGTAGIADLWQTTGADGWAENGRDAVELARQWWTTTRTRNP